ncbi:16S rRNA (cytosine(1402)-N(4))-methyltransferase RsmH [Labrys monachus]|uniref:Ribosomal RNA small subunit methyltransferase H n=1 Tax=Labrys monachus TaxID=217067 RepID=A0ABU0FL96_9HYPH|nr:16S rRNA (cytosine(1402)-N(4))-methyltransferase RsmH [Labrys monachus]MDQ0395266.1 16S rRNA (cytosine1402-N4)-methyltransferase [Labrys monachus]
MSAIPTSSNDVPAHVPVMLAEVLAALAPAAGEGFIDGTFGAGGYTRAILAAAPDTRVVAIDRDRRAVTDGMALVSEMKGRLTLVEDRFSNLEGVAPMLGEGGVDGIVLDIGVSSMQLDQAERGFSFRRDGPLDMRMSNTGASAADLIATLPQEALARIFQVLGEERRAGALARAIVTDRAATPFLRTSQLAELCARVIRSRPGEIHPATRAFQALRIAVNGELEELGLALLAAERVLKPGGRLVVVTFHSLEDRIVKTFFADRTRSQAGGSRHAPELSVPSPTFVQASRNPLAASAEEASANPRARSAKLRFGTRTAAPARDTGTGFLGLPDIHVQSGRGR